MYAIPSSANETLNYTSLIRHMYVGYVIYSMLTPAQLMRPALVYWLKRVPHSLVGDFVHWQAFVSREMCMVYHTCMIYRARVTKPQVAGRV